MHPDSSTKNIIFKNKDLNTSAKLCDDVLTLTIGYEEKSLSIRMDAADAHHLFTVLDDALGTQTMELPIILTVDLPPH